MAPRRRRQDDFSDYYEEFPQRPSRASSRSENGGAIWPHLLALLVVGVLFLGSAWLVAGRVMLEKTLQSLVAPCGLVWLGLLLTSYFCLVRRYRFPAAISVLSWLVLTVAGNSLFSGWLIGSLEADYHDFELEKVEALDAVLVLGGGAWYDPTGREQGTAFADRLIVAAWLYRNNKVTTLLCGGYSGSPHSKGTAAQASMGLLESLDVPQEAMILLSGRNTLEEVRAFDRWVFEQERKDLRVGILTSAWHLQRAIRLADAVGVEATPLPSNFLSRRYRPGPDLIIPSAENVWITQLALKEMLAAVWSR